MRLPHAFCLFALSLLLVGTAHTQAPANATAAARVIGQPFLTSYSMDEYGAGARNWSVAQDTRGVIYVANGDDGVLEYDGATWRIIPLSNSLTRVVASDRSGRVWVGGVAEIGYLAPDARGKATFVSIVDRIPEADRPSADVWTIHDTPSGLYFNTRAHLYRYKEGRVRAWAAPDSAQLGFIFPARGTLYAHLPGAGLARLEGDALVSVPGGERFANVRVTVMLPFGRNTRGAEVTLVGTYDGLFLYDGRTFSPFRTEVDELLRSHAPYRPGAVLPGGQVALGTLGGGVLVIDRSGRLVRRIDRVSGLLSNTVYYTFVDRDGALWLALSRGLARVDVSSPLTRFGEGQGVLESTYDLVRHRGRLYAGTNDGALVLDETTGTFGPIAGTASQVFSLVPYRGGLLAWAARSGLHRIEGTRAVPQQVNVFGQVGAIAMKRAHQDSSRIFVSILDDLGMLHNAGGDRWTFTRIPGTDGSYQIVQDAGGDLWIGSVRSGIQRVHFPAGLERVEQARVTNYELPGRLAASVDRVGSTIYAATSTALYRFDERRGAFVTASSFPEWARGAASPLNAVTQDARGRVWWSIGRGVGVLPPPRDNAPPLAGPFQRLLQIAASRILPEPDGVTWFATENGIIRYDERLARLDPRTVATLVRTVAAGDSILYGGAVAPTARAPRLAYDDNAVRFDFAAPFFGADGQTEYRTYLEGYEDSAEAWSPASYKEYTNLAPGDYVFHVTARSATGQTATEATYPFSVVPPWWRTWWAYLFYALLFGSAVFAVDRVQRRRLVAKERERARERELQQAREIEAAYTQLKGAQQQLVQQEKLASLGALTAGIAHEIKNPLNFVNNFAALSEELVSEIKTERAEKPDLRVSDVEDLLDDLQSNAARIREHGQRADSIVKNMLAHSRGNAGVREAVDVNGLLEEYTSLAFHGMRAQRPDFTCTIERSFDASVGTVEAVPQDLSRVVLNLVGNALYAVADRKARQNGQDDGEGFVPTVRVTTRAAGDSVEVRVWDNGGGIPESVRAKIFEPFFTTKPAGEGTGLGLSLSHDIVAAHGGTLAVESAEGETTFTLTLPTAGVSNEVAS